MDILPQYRLYRKARLGRSSYRAGQSNPNRRSVKLISPLPEWSREGLAAAPRGCCVILKIMVSCLQQPMGLAEKRCTLTEE